MAERHVVGRSDELATLDRALSAAYEGEGRLVLVVGEPGIGKTTLCSSFTERARLRGARVLWGRAWEWGGAPPFWSWIQVLRAIEAALLELPGAAGNAADARFALFDRVTERLRSETQTSPLCVVLEDLHAADVPSLLLLRFAVEQLRDARVVLIGTWRTIEASPAPEVSALLADLSRVARTIDLAGLSTDEIAELASRHRADNPREWAAMIHDRTDGNPLLVSALLEAGAAGLSERELPTRARVAVERRIGRLDRAARKVLSAASVIGREMAVLVLAKVCDQSLHEVLESVRALSAAQILVERSDALGRYGFRHGLFREVAYAALSPAERLSLHRAAGRALEDLYGAERERHLSELACHFLAVSPDAELGVRYAAGAGEHAMLSLAYEDAAGHFERAILALAAGPAESSRACELWLRLGDAQSAAGLTTAARDSYRRARRLSMESAHETLAARVAIAFARIAGFGNADPESAEWLDEAAARVTDPALRARLLAELIGRVWPLPEAAERIDGLVRETLDLARQVGDKRLYADALARSMVLIWSPDTTTFAEHRARAEELVGLSDLIGDDELRVEALRWSFTTSMIQGDIEKAKRLLDGYERLADRLARPQLRFNALLRRIMLAELEGRLDDVRELLPLAEQAGRRAGDPQLGYLVTAIELMLHCLCDRKSALDGLLLQWRETVGSQLPQSVVSATTARVKAQLAQRQEASRALDDYLKAPPGVLARSAPLAAVHAVWAIWRLGEAPRARVLLSALAPGEELVWMGGAVQFFGPGSLYLGLLSATAGEPERAARLLEQATRRLGEMGARPLLAKAKNALGVVLSRVDPDRASALRREAADEARALGVWLEEPLEAGGSIAPAATHAAAYTAGVFIAEGDYYTVGLGGSVSRVRSSKGLCYIDKLLRCEGTEVHVLDLVGSALDDRSGDGPMLDERAKAEYRRRIRALQSEIDEAQQFADVGRSSRAHEELEALFAELARSAGLGGRDRVTGIAERARASVTLAIRRAVRGLRDADPALFAHFSSAIATGTFCAYRPEPRARVAWTFVGVAS